MATKKTTKSNKTSHVLNLLTSAPVAEEGLEQAGGSAQANAGGNASGGNASGGAGVTLDPNMLSDFHEAAKKTKEAAEHFRIPLLPLQEQERMLRKSSLRKSIRKKYRRKRNIKKSSIKKN